MGKWPRLHVQVPLSVVESLDLTKNKSGNENPPNWVNEWKSGLDCHLQVPILWQLIDKGGGNFLSRIRMLSVLVVDGA